MRTTGLIMIGILCASCGASRSPTKAAALAATSTMKPSASPKAPVDSAVRPTPAAPPVVSTPVDCELTASPRETWTDTFVEGDSPFSPYRVNMNGTWSPSKLEQCNLLRHQLVKGTKKLECYEVKGRANGGLWAILTTEPSDTEPHSFWQAFYIDEKGRKTASLLEAASSPYGDPAVPGNEGQSEPVPVALFDVNGDGAEELFLATSQASDAAGHRSTTVTILTSTAKGVRSYPPTVDLHAIMIEASTDGRPELVVDPYAGAAVGSATNGWLKSRAAWSLVVEFDASGKIVSDGAGSRGYARTLCPSPNGLIEGLGKTDAVCVAAYAHCARLWGNTTEAVETALQTFCAREEKDAPQGAGWCDASFDTWDKIAKREPPFVLHQ